MYKDVLSNSYADKKIVELFSDENRYFIWRKLWWKLAFFQKQLGLSISNDQLQQMENNLKSFDLNEVAKIEENLKHDVMSHLHHFGNQAPLAKPIMHLGATSEYIKDNCDIILIKEALEIISTKLLTIIQDLSNFAIKYKSTPCIAYTHFQVAQPTTVGKRACMWLQSFLIDHGELTHFIDNLKFRGIKGTTGTLASFKELFNNDYNKVQELNNLISKSFGFDKSFLITGQTYDRKIDSLLMNMLSNIGISAHKMTNDIRLLQNLKEIEESFGKDQVGSSAMPYKKNPIKCERISSLSKYLMSLPLSANMVASTQWLERTLDDSANRRITIPQGFFTTSAILDLLHDVIQNMVVNVSVINKNLSNEIPFLATENIMMESVKNGADRQDVHEKIRKYSIETKIDIIENGSNNNLLDKILEDKSFNLNKENLNNIINIDNFIGFSVEQVEDFITNQVGLILKTNTN